MRLLTTETTVAVAINHLEMFIAELSTEPVRGY